MSIATREQVIRRLYSNPVSDLRSRLLGGYWSYRVFDPDSIGLQVDGRVAHGMVRAGLLIQVQTANSFRVHVLSREGIRQAEILQEEGQHSERCL